MKKLAQYAGCAMMLLSSGLRAENQLPEQSDSLWLDRAHDSAATGVDNIALWLDGFFGDQQTEDEAFAKSYLRVIGRYLWHQNADNEPHMRLRGTLYLPNISDRLSLIFDDDSTASEPSDSMPGAETESPEIGIKWRLSQRDFSGIDLTAHWRDSGVRPGVRYRREMPLADDVGMRFYHRFDYGKEGWETSSEIMFDKKITNNHLYRWRTRVDTTLGDQPAHWRTVLQSRYVQGSGADSIGRQWFAGVAGEGSVGWEEMAKYVGFTWRRSYLRDYLWFEVEPRYTWQSAMCDCDTASVQLRVEVLLFDPE